MARDIFSDMKDFGPEKMKGAKGILAVIVILVLILAFRSVSPFVMVGAGERGVVLTFNAVQPGVLGEGLHFIIPFMQSVIKIDVRIQKTQTETTASSKDLQEVNSTIALNYNIVPDKANDVYQKIGLQYKERIIDPAVEEVVKAVTALFTAEELITKRPVVSTEMKKGLTERLGRSNIQVDEFSIVNFAFSKPFMEAIESKQAAEQLALKASRDLDRIKIEAEQKITQAKAEAEALRLQREIVTPELVKLRQIEATIKAIDKWNGVLPKVTSSSIPLINVSDDQK